jgi:hypothetical protein
MTRRGPMVIWCTLLVSLAVPRTSDARSLLDIIWEMSGPQLIGVTVVSCQIDMDGERHQCHVVGRKVTGADTSRESRAWFSLEAGLYSTTGRDTNNVYDAFTVHMLAVEPTVEVRSIRSNDIRLYHGAGLTYNVLFGRDFQRFDKAGVKLRPIGVSYRQWDFAYNLRLYPRGFTSDEFGFGPRVDGDRPFEAVHGFSVGYSW